MFVNWFGTGTTNSVSGGDWSEDACATKRAWPVSSASAFPLTESMLTMCVVSACT